MNKVAFVTSSPMTVKAFLLPFINELVKDNEVHVFANWSDNDEVDFLPQEAIKKNIKIPRNPNLLVDFLSLLKLVKIFHLEKYQIVHTFTPKAGLVGQLASFISGVDNRYHTFTGQVWATKTGWKKQMLKQLDKLTASLASAALADSHSQQEYLIQNKVVLSNKIMVLGKGSISGVNLSKFKFSAEKRNELRNDLGICSDEFVFLYAGRLKLDKGIPELLAAFKEVSKKIRCVLIIVGVDEDGLLPLVESTDKVIFCGFSNDMPAYFSMADLLCLPSHREGFGNVVIEAAACGLPSLASNIYGLSDAIVDGETGILHKVNDVKDIESKMCFISNNKNKLHKFSVCGFDRVKHDFSEDTIVSELIKFYERLNVTQVKNA